MRDRLVLRNKLKERRIDEEVFSLIDLLRRRNVLSSDKSIESNKNLREKNVFNKFIFEYVVEIK